MHSRDKHRLAAARMATQILRHRDFAGSFAASGEEAGLVEHVVLVALPEDPLGTIFDRLNSYDTTVNVVVPMADGAALNIISLSPTGADNDDCCDDCCCEVHESTEIGMLLTYMREVRRPVRLRRIKVQLVEDGKDGNRGEPAAV